MSTVSFGPPTRPRRTASEKGVRFAAALAILTAAGLGVFGTGLVAPTDRNLMIGGTVLAVYLLVAYFVDLEPDYENLGEPLLPDHSRRLPVLPLFRLNDPFQASDDVSREFLFLRLLLVPGRFVSVALTDPVFARRGRRDD